MLDDWTQRYLWIYTTDAADDGAGTVLLLRAMVFHYCFG